MFFLMVFKSLLAIYGLSLCPWVDFEAMQAEATTHKILNNIRTAFKIIQLSIVTGLMLGGEWCREFNVRVAKIVGFIALATFLNCQI